MNPGIELVPGCTASAPAFPPSATTAPPVAPRRAWLIGAAAGAVGVT
ncbi:MAG TPA: hypothetical protein VL595_17055 [Pseudonocardia sp.]|nr:hypothetical protein [Pseudonocardia sp.]